MEANAAMNHISAGGDERTLCGYIVDWFLAVPQKDRVKLVKYNCDEDNNIFQLQFGWSHLHLYLNILLENKAHSAYATQVQKCGPINKISSHRRQKSP